MEHEVFLPCDIAAVARALGEPERAARCVPGLRLDPEGDPLAPAGRLRLRIGSSSLTYRGGLTVIPRGEGFAVEAQGHEARGTGSATLLLTVVPRPSDDGTGTVLAFGGAVEAKGRLDEFEPQQREAAGRRLLDRFAEALADEVALAAESAAEGAAAEGGPPVPGGIGEPGDNERAIPGIPPPPDSVAEPADLDIPPPTLDPGVEEEAPEPEADFARRTMIGRSAEEVDHAPPRGRYAPEPAPGRTSVPVATLRWAAPAAAAAVATAIVVARALRRRR
ncbi:carbon monoxide dehydrogenase subunit G [Streptomyces radicis]|uniref:Carbon monoxide dehydrogenase subunit G n=1 Tax=Streptomyces radicis TaxID=1750517 RepID=A0A3A9WFU7_9ACTN|nr:carbon monoxide dehydrogenase subunit G [Streptomyces radicis]RKN11492.1 carbon monoxide dehydrogenase subunit G [Streptomyces radicis]RKN26489.1 carbon monoxide dehydrogenase subunit G [Streptomyces radicis]